MPLPYSFILGLGCLFAAWDVTLDLPKSAELQPLYLALVVVPWIVIRILLVRRVPRVPATRMSVLLRGVAQQLIVPAAYLTMLIPGQLAGLAEEWCGGSLFVMTSLGLFPLLVMELGANFAQRQVAGQHGLAGGPPLRIPLIGFLTLMLLLFTAGLDLLALSRELEVFVASTSLGQTVGIVLFLGLMSAVLPLLFRLVVSASSRVPEDARRTAGALGFPGRDVLLMRTGYRLVNAMLVGPLPRLRFLFLTDGLVSLLDPVSLRGVVAHEVGHAKAGHPLLLLSLFGLIPLLLYCPLALVGVSRLDPVLSTCLWAGVLVGAFLLVRRIAHRFELEADLLSADALGGSTPCLLALHKVGEMTGGSPTKAGFRHPSEETRIQHLLSCEGDPWYRERFRRRSKQLRWSIAVSVCLAALLSGYAHNRLWPIDSVILNLYTGRFPAAESAMADLPRPLPAGYDGLVGELREQLSVARTLYPAGGEWDDIREDLAARALVKGGQELIRRGGRAARPWFAIGMLKSQPTPFEQSLFLYCRAEANEDPARVEELRQHLLREFELEPELREALMR